MSVIGKSSPDNNNNNNSNTNSTNLSLGWIVTDFWNANDTVYNNNNNNNNITSISKSIHDNNIKTTKNFNKIPTISIITTIILIIKTTTP